MALELMFVLEVVGIGVGKGIGPGAWAGLSVRIAQSLALAPGLPQASEQVDVRGLCRCG